ncbi:putative ArsR family transcriptional regulator [Microlunatus capsulatus]|uniref:ArsR family transcriptional regulator n=1 Tax=Microlunatus capsulatus TaxID=99117 RepID=A0ABS4ZBU1_9ACTN|nr:putative ArsR family transcriptional regulator [Microlunatus capsulatus]
MKNLQDVATRAPGPGTPEDAPRPGPEADASTRHRVALSILEHGPSTAAALGDRLGLTAAAVRRHLDGLLERGVLTAREQRVYGSRGRGRPAKVFALTDAGRADFPAAYDDIAIAALEFLADEVGSSAVRTFAERRAAPAEARYREAVDGADPSVSPALALAAALTADGYVASVRPSALGEQLCQHHCPVAHVAERFPQLCEVETEMFSRVLGVHVQRLATLAHGDGVCTTHVPTSSGAAPAAAAPAPPGMTPPHDLDMTTPEERPAP